MKITEDQVLILGCHNSKDNIKTAHAIGTQRFTLFKLELNEDIELKAQDKIFIGEGNDKIKKIITTMSYHDLSNNEKNEVECGDREKYNRYMPCIISAYARRLWHT